METSPAPAAAPAEDGPEHRAPRRPLDTRLELAQAVLDRTGAVFVVYPGGVPTPLPGRGGGDLKK